MIHLATKSRRVHNYTKGQQSPVETTLNPIDQDFYFDLHHIAQTHEDQSSKLAFFI